MAEPEALTVRDLLDELNAIVRSFPAALNDRVYCGDNERALIVTTGTGVVFIETDSQDLTRAARDGRDEAVRGARDDFLAEAEDALARCPDLDSDAAEKILKELEARI